MESKVQSFGTLKKSIQLCCFVLSLALLGQQAFALELYPEDQSDTQKNNEYYTIDESTLQNPQMLNPLHIAEQIIDNSLEAIEAQVKTLNLLTWAHHSQAQEAPAEPYNRRLQFGRWINDPTDTTCYNTRAKVLMRDSKVPVQFKSYNKCLVQYGQWDDAYSNRVYTEARDIQIDHMVPLKNAYISGAHRWKANKKCLFANFLANNHHLIAAGARENMSKGDRTPAEYMPSNPSYQCQYLVNWLKIKLSWQLEMTSSEAYAIRQIAAKENCEPKMFEMNISDVVADRDAQSIAPEVCRKEL